MVNLDELMRLHDAATPGPWGPNIDGHISSAKGMVCHKVHVYNTPDGREYDLPYKDDAAYICAACGAVPELVKRVRELEDQVTFLNKVAGNLAYNPCLTCVDNGHSCPRELYSPDNDDIESVLVCCRMKHAWRDARIQMLVDKGKEFKGHPECPTPETPCHARNGELCMSDNHLVCSHSANEDSFIMRRFTEVK